jgi:hypothetical protein
MGYEDDNGVFLISRLRMGGVGNPGLHIFVVVVVKTPLFSLYILASRTLDVVALLLLLR